MKKTFVFVAAVLAAIQSAMPEANAEGKYPMDEPALAALENASDVINDVVMNEL